MHNFVSAFLGLIFLAVQAFAIPAPDSASVEYQLQEFDSDPAHYLNTPPQRRVVQSHPFSILREESEFASLSDSIKAKSETRQILIKRSEITDFAEGTEAIEKILSADELKKTNGVILRRLEDMERYGWRQKSLALTAWSGTGWPTWMGGIAQRYASLAFLRAGKVWSALYAYVTAPGTTFFDIYKERNAKRIDLLSGAEKYDLLIGDLSDSSNGYLTPKQWEKGAKVVERLGDVPRWFGICHGWAPASFMFPRPRLPIEVMAADGVTKLKFWPADLKALASAMWADGISKVRFMGKRCDIEKPPRDAIGRVIAPECFDVNPALWHMALVNQLNSAERHLIMDATYDVQVWNQPLVAYSYAYFNPQTKRTARTLAEATVPIQVFTNDKFKAYRSPKAASVVGVALNARYIEGTPAGHRPVDDPKGDLYIDVSYLYDVELDASGNMIGGEWYKNAHPDFLWVPAPNMKPVSSFENEAISQWSGTGPLPEDWRAAAKKAAQKTQPLAKIVEALLAQSAR